MSPTEALPLSTSRVFNAALQRALATLQRWLVADAYPLWAQQGVDRRLGGFHELVGQHGPIADEPRRARVQVRQIYCFARARSCGWEGDAERLVAQGWAYFFRCYLRPDGLFRTLVAPDGQVLDDRAYLYDQAFVLLALAESQRSLGARSEYLAAAQALRSRLQTLLKCSGPGFASGLPEALPLLANAHMHLLEALQSWAAIDQDPCWQTLADEIVDLALRRMIDPGSGALLERFDAQWRALAGSAERLVEPGHQFEWAWLLLRGPSATPRAQLIDAATRLVQVGEACGVRHGVAIATIHVDGTVRDGDARLWPQTERLKAALALAGVAGGAHYWSMATRAANSILRYLNTDVPGLWHDRLTTTGVLIDEPAPASSFYHVVCAIGELTAALAPRP